MDTIILFLFVPINVILGLFLLLNNSKSWTNRLFALLIFILTLYLGINTELYVFTSYEMRLFLSRFIISLGSLINLLVFLFLITFPNDKINLKKKILYPLLFLTGFLFVAGFTKLIFANINIENNIVVPIPGVVMPVFLIHTLALIFGGILAIFLRYRKSQGITKNRIRYVLFGFLILFSLIIILNFLVTVFLKFGNFVPFLPFYILIFNFIVGYAIVRHRLMDIRLVVARAVSFTILIFVLALVYSSVVLVLGGIFFNIQLNTNQLLILTFLSVLVAFSFTPLQRVFERYTDRLLFKDRYSTDTVLASLSKIMASTLRLDELTHGMLEILLKEVKISKAAFILLDKGSVVDVKSEGYKIPPTLDESEIILLNQRRKMIVFDELGEDKFKNILRKLEFNLVMPLNTEKNQVGILVIGTKESGEIYSEQDLNLVEILAPEAAIAIQNAKAYEEIRRFNITLQEEVDRATKDLQSANEKLQELDKLKDEFVSLASHELRSPMTAIKGSLSTILDGYAGDITQNSREFLTAAYNENDRLIRLVNNLLNISRIEAGRFTFTLTKINLEKIIREIIQNMQNVATERKIFLKYLGDGQLPMVLGDGDKVKEVVINLVGNALKFTHKGGVTVQLRHKDNMVVTSVTDTGSGIAKEDQELLFKKFSQVGKNYARPAGGTGLGLYICKQIVEGLKGSIWLESTLEKGSTFYFSLPIAK